jgi:monoamine oxidase
MSKTNLPLSRHLGGAFGKLAALVRRGLHAVPFLRVTVRRLRAFHERVRPVVWLLEGEEREIGRSLRILFSGQLENKNYIAHMAFRGSCAQRRLGRRSLRLLLRLGQSGPPLGADISLIEIAEDAHRRMVRRPGFFVPCWVGGEVDITDALRRMQASKGTRQDLRRLGERAIELVATRDAAAYESFYEKMYAPYVRAMFGDRTFAMSREEMVGAQPCSELLLLKLDGEVIVGQIVLYESTRVRLWSVGVKDGDRVYLKGGTMKALDDLTFRYLAAKGYRFVHLGASRPFLRDGALDYKRRLGLRVTDQGGRGFVLRYRAESRAAAAFLAANPFIYFEDGQFKAAVHADAQTCEAQSARVALRERYALAGLATVSFFSLPAAGDAQTTGTADAAGVGAPQHPERRMFVMACAATLALGACEVVEFEERRTAPKRVVVVGAGLAGLAAAAELTRLGHAVTVLEAQERSGGRVLTLRAPLAEGLYGEAGAARIPDGHKITLEYVRRFGLGLEPFYPSAGRFVVQEGGERHVTGWGDFAEAVERNVGSHLDQHRFGWRVDGTTHWFRIIGGNDRLPRAMAEQLGERVHYESPVQRIVQDARGVGVRFRDRGRAGWIEADRLVCTLAFPLVRHIDFSPALSPAKQEVVEEMAYAMAARIYLQCHSRFWDANGENGFAISDWPAEIWQPSFNRAGTRGLLGVYVRHTEAIQLLVHGERGRVGAALARLEDIFPGSNKAFERGVEKFWCQDKWAGGAYSAPRPHATEVAARPEGRIHFAGEHTSRWNAWMQGALESGLRAAREIDKA